MALEGKLLRLDQVAQIIQVHPRTVRRYIDEGKLKGHNPNPGRKGLRVTVESLREYLRKYELPNYDLSGKMNLTLCEKFDPPFWNGSDMYSEIASITVK